MSDLEEVLNGDTSEPVEPANPVLTESVADDLKAELAEPADEEVSTPAVEKTETIEEPAKEASELSGLKAGIAAERHKRQDLEQQLRTMQQQQQEAAPKPDFWENPDDAISNLKTGFNEDLRRTKVDLSTEMMRELHADYEDKETQFIELGQSNPALFI